MQRVGIGYDIHRLEIGRKLILGGVQIPFEKGLVAHSDGDVLIHAIIDALLGAMGERDIGNFFPDTDKKYKDISSSILLKEIVKKIKEKNVEIVNIDSTIIIEKPKISDFIDEIEKKLSEILEINPENISIKAKTNETIGEIGKGDAIATFSVASIIIKK